MAGSNDPKWASIYEVCRQLDISDRSILSNLLRQYKEYDKKSVLIKSPIYVKGCLLKKSQILDSTKEIIAKNQTAALVRLITELQRRSLIKNGQQMSHSLMV